AFETIVAAGAHGSLPHYRPGKTKIRPDQAVLIDWGAKVDGYCSDLTRVVFTGTIPPKIEEIYTVVLRAQKAAISAIKAQVSCKAVDAAARKIIEQAGYGEQFIHGLGHGIGLQIHEAPSVGRRSDKRLRQGMVVTVEPGIYLPGVGGVRIEDDVLVEANGQRKLTSLPKTLKTMVLR
ncbi:MAG: M24 family metallopeptidase, partial [Planctomycetota bacterium]